MYQLYILDKWESLAQFCAIVAEHKIICAPTSACGNTWKLQCDPLTSVSSLTSPRVRGGIHEEAFQVVVSLMTCLFLSQTARNTLKYLMELMLLPCLK